MLATHVLNSITKHASSARPKLKHLRRLCRNRIGFCKTCLALLLVACVFLAMYGYIRVTYMIGFKQ